jgi:hypothetical protein
MDDPRSDELLAECGRAAARLGLAIAWTDGISGEAAKACTRTGAGAWKNARPFTDPEQAAGFYVQRCRRKNPVVVASASGLVLVESDDGGIDELAEKHALPPLPRSVRVRSRRGEHAYYRPPDGYTGPLKFQLAPDGVTCSSDGYLVGAGALHTSGLVYTYLGVPL